MANEYSCCASPDVELPLVKVGDATIDIAKLTWSLNNCTIPEEALMILMAKRS